MGFASLFMVIAAGPMIRQLEFCDGRVLIDGSFPSWDGPQGIGSASHTDEHGRVDVRFYGIHFGPFRWVVTRYYRET